MGTARTAGKVRAPAMVTKNKQVNNATRGNPMSEQVSVRTRQAAPVENLAAHSRKVVSDTGDIRPQLGQGPQGQGSGIRPGTPSARVFGDTGEVGRGPRNRFNGEPSLLEQQQITPSAQSVVVPSAGTGTGPGTGATRMRGPMSEHTAAHGHGQEVLAAGARVVTNTAVTVIEAVGSIVTDAIHAAVVNTPKPNRWKDVVPFTAQALLDPACVPDEDHHWRRNSPASATARAWEAAPAPALPEPAFVPEDHHWQRNSPASATTRAWEAAPAPWPAPWPTPGLATTPAPAVHRWVSMFLLCLCIVILAVWFVQGLRRH